MNKEDQQKLMQIIIGSGKVKLMVSEATQVSKNYRFKEAEKLLNNAKEELIKVHNIHTSMLDSSVYSEDINILSIHSEDHLMSASLMFDMAKEFIDVYIRLSEIEKNSLDSV